MSRVSERAPQVPKKFYRGKKKRHPLKTQLVRCQYFAPVELCYIKPLRDWGIKAIKAGINSMPMAFPQPSLEEVVECAADQQHNYQLAPRRVIGEHIDRLKSFKILLECYAIAGDALAYGV